jgi:hypothetical protein
VSAEGPRPLALVRFFDGERQIGADRRGQDGLYSVVWRPAGRERHLLRAVAVDASGRTTAATRLLRRCS